VCSYVYVRFTQLMAVPALQDPLVTLAMAQAYESIPGCQAVYFPSETHTTLVVNRLGLALEALVAKQTAVHAPAVHEAAAVLAGDSPVARVVACIEQQQVLLPSGLSHSSSSSHLASAP
jgi:hypothetical protein